MRLLTIVAALAFLAAPALSQPATWWVDVPAPGTSSTGNVEALWLQQSQSSAGSDFCVGTFRTADGRTWIIEGKVKAGNGVPVAPPPPIASPPQIVGNVSEPGKVLAPVYTFSSWAGTEEGTTFLWMSGAEVLGTERTYTTQAKDSGARILLTVTPRASTGATGPEAAGEVQLGSWDTSGPGTPPGGPDGPEWRVPPEWDAVLTKAHPRGPGPIAGPHPQAGPYLEVADLDRHTGKADSWDPDGYVSAQWAWQAMDLAVAWRATGNPAYLTKATDFLVRLLGPAPPTHTWAWMAGAIIGDHFWDDLPTDIRGGAQEIIRQQLDLHYQRSLNGWSGWSGWSDLYWEGWTQSAGAHGFAWALAVWAKDTPEWRPLWDWWGHQFFLSYAPLYHTICTGPDGGSFPQQAYWNSNVGGYIPQLHLVLEVATGLDTWTIPENGGYLGPMLEMAWQRQLPSGQDVSFGNQTNSWYYPPYSRGLVALKDGALIAHATRNPEGQWRAHIDGHTDPLVPSSQPWGHFPPALTPTKPADPEKEWRCAHLGMSRTGWGEDDTVISWTRGPWLLGHHRTYGPGHFTMFGGGGWLVGHPRHYGFGSGSEFWDRHITYNGLRFESETDTAPTESYTFTTAPPSADHPNGQKAVLPYPADGGPNLTGQNPHNYRLAQAAPFPGDPWLDFQQRPGAFRHAVELGHGPGWESIDWSPGFRALDPAEAGLLFRPGVNSRGDRIQKWVRCLVWGPDWLVVLDDAEPLEGVRPVWDLHLHGQPDLSDGGWHLERTGTLTSAEGGHPWPHVMPPATRRQGTELRLDGHLWVRQLAGGGAWTSEPTPQSGIRQWPHPGQTEMADGKGPDDWAWWRLRLRQSAGPICVVLQARAEELPVSWTASPTTFTVNVGNSAIEIDRTSFQVTRQ